MPPSQATSALYECRVLHERHHPKRNRFVHRLFYFCLDLDELPTVHRRLRLFSIDSTNLFALRTRDYMPVDETPHNPGDGETHMRALPAGATGLSLKQRVRRFCAVHGADFGEDGRVLLVTLPRVFGYQFNPVSFYFCFDAAGTPTGAIAEVTNTYREIKPYFIPALRTDTRANEAGAAGRTEGARRPAPTLFRLRTPKHFYVSPFSGLELHFDFTLRLPGERLAIRIDDLEGERCVLHSTLTGHRAPLTDAILARFIIQYPLMTLTVMALIHWHALVLWLRRLPHHRKAAGAAHQRGLYRPHASLTQPSSDRISA